MPEIREEDIQDIQNETDKISALKIPEKKSKKLSPTKMIKGQAMVKHWIYNGFDKKKTMKKFGITKEGLDYTLDRMQDYIKKFLKAASLDNKAIITQLQFIVFESRKRGDFRSSIRALELIGKHLGMWERNYTTENDDNKKSLDELINEQEKLIAEMKAYQKNKMEENSKEEDIQEAEVILNEPAGE